MTKKVIALAVAASLLALLPDQYSLVWFAAPRIASWIGTGFLIASCITVILAIILALPFKQAARAAAISISVILFAMLALLSGTGLKIIPWALIVGIVMAVIGVFMPPNLGKAFSVLLGLCVFSWLYLALVYAPSAVFYVDYFYRLEGNLAGSLASMLAALREEALTAALMLPSLFLYLIVRGSQIQNQGLKPTAKAAA